MARKPGIGLVALATAGTLTAGTLAAGTPAFAQTVTGPTGQELAWSSAAQRTGAFTTNAWATRGSGVTVAVIDSGIRVDHREFQGAIVGGFNAFSGLSGTSVVTDTNGHGTHVASIIAARANNFGMAGVASRASLLPVQVFNGPTTSDAVVARGVNWATGRRAFVVNMSLGGPAPSTTMRESIRAGVNAGQLFVVAAGNEGQANPAWPARFATESWARGQIIVVGAVDANNRIASFSNRAGDSRNFFLVAPGTSIIGAYHTSSTAYVAMSGTSMAAPVVAGSAAVVKSAWPWLSAQQVASILFTTATDLGTPGVDAIYGRGMVNLTRALQPVGRVAAVGASGPVTLGSGATGSGGATFGPMAAASQSGATVGVVFDAFGRDFGYDFGWRTSLARPSGASVAGDSLGARMGAPIDSMDVPGGRISFGELPGSAGDSAVSSGSVRFDAASGAGWAVAVGDSAALTGALSGGATLAPTATVGAAYAGLVQGNAAGASIWRPVTSQVTMGFSARVEDTPATFATLDRGPQARTGAAAIDASLTWQDGPVRLGATVTAVSEQRGRLGSVDSSEQALAGSANTLATTVTAAWQAGANTSLVASVAAGTTAPQSGAAASVVRDVERTGTAAWSVGLVQSNVFRSGDRLDLTVSMPLTSVSGAVNMRMATGADLETGAPIVEDRRISLRSQTPEQRTEVAYVSPWGESGSVGVGVMSRRDADGVRGREETAVAVRFSTRF